MTRRPTITELEKIMVREDEHTVTILPDGTVVIDPTAPRPPSILSRDLPRGESYY